MSHIGPAEDRGAAGGSKGGTLSIVSEHRLPFGIAISSNAGQRTAELYLAIFRRRFGREEEEYLARILSPENGACAAASALDEATRRIGGSCLTDACQWTARRQTHASTLLNLVETKATPSELMTCVAKNYVT